ncbi:MAG: DNA-directed RNA polymerase subunit beta [Candidatus Handelsmanbacteria bacterium RIFCSPLOWO2_12_FULL_64_10]|uniref:DNA-directed RNA polymerase subunit beta n=1 Tax=Handelsmanbacteria sp. (strain RIFCSPLOWO2_12_FULL_64_10) TaxID=1817868 RepID=A0A1F6CNA0_HANXR|nr:MAG: DNA-directed RNA polymerase subunit beta [Candidatus Handelsmanbacteria bacterium RIFCSPLOWO2_12_FULL_64_10]
MAAKKGFIERRSYAKLPEPIDMPNLLDIQIDSYRWFLQADILPEQRKNQGLQAVFNSIFPITDVHNFYSLEFVDYSIGAPKYGVEECQERGTTYAAPLRATLRLISRDRQDKEIRVKDIVEQTVFLGELPLMTEQGTFIINGSERVIVSQLHRSPGVFFDETTHPNGKRLFSARIIPFRGSWLEFSMDINDVMYVHIERKRKLPVTLFLRALGYSKNGEILSLFHGDTSIRADEEAVGRILVADGVDKRSGEVVVEAFQTLTEEHVQALKEARVSRIDVLDVNEANDAGVVTNTLKKDPTDDAEEALARIYNLLRPGDPPNVETARGLLERLFFSPKRYHLGEVGRYRINQRFDVNIALDYTVLHVEDFLRLIYYLIELRKGNGHTDDIDHLGNRRIRSVGELLAQQFSVGMSRMARTIRERMSLRDSESLTPHDLINARTISTVVGSFFGSSQLSQFMQQTNPLDELTHKRRLSALGPGGLTRDRAGFEVRDVHHTHYGRICPIETPEGPNIGLIASLSTYARVNRFGFLETPYRVVKNGRVTEEIEYLAADHEDRHVIAQANAQTDKRGRFIQALVQARLRGDFPLVPPTDVNYMDVSPKQLVSAAAALIPFLEHDDANRALMGSNMQRQAVPLLRTDAPLVGTGMERKVAIDSGAVILAKNPGVVAYVSADRVVVKRDRPKGGEIIDLFDTDIYRLTKFKRSNQDCCINQRPIVRKGDRVVAGDALADGCATDRGDLALGANVLCAFMSWNGYNFEDAIIVSERLLKEDTFTSIHIEEFELQVRDTKRGAEEITREIPNVSEQAVRNLDEQGIIRVGAEVGPSDILVGKVTPKGETELSPEERLLRAIFGEKAGDVRDASLRAPSGMDGVVMDRKVFSRKERDEKTKKSDREKTNRLKADIKTKIDGIKAARDEQVKELLLDRKVGLLRNVEDNSVFAREGKVFDRKTADRIDLDVIRPDDAWTDDRRTDQRVQQIVEMADRLTAQANGEMEREMDKIARGDELPPGIVQLVKVYVARKRKLSVGDKMAGRHGNKGVVSIIVPEEDMPYLPDGTPADIILNPLGVPSRMNLGQIFETHLGWAAGELNAYMATPVFDGATFEEVQATLEEAGLPRTGKTVLYDGKTGEPFDKEVVVGKIYMMKLSHLVADKIHARSIGPYSLVTQQPLGGKAQFGGQRFGEMEVWALEAYGAAHMLQEMLTVKSDDVAGRSKIYEAIVKGDNPPEPGIPESFNVLVKELQSLCMDVVLEGGEEG